MLKLYNFQLDYMKKIDGRNWIYDCDTGTGKTIMGLKHYKAFNMLRLNSAPLLIVAPASKINEGGWQRTIDEYYPNTKYDTLSYNMLAKKYKEYEDYFVIFDECHRLKNSTGVWGKSGFNLSKIASGFILLSATPLSNGWVDSINYFKIFNLTKNKTQFLRENAITSTDYGYIDIIGWRNENKLKNMWRQISSRLNKEDAIDLPDLVFKEVRFKTSKEYQIIKKDRIFKDIIYDNPMKLRHGLRLFTNLKDKVEYLKEFVESTSDNIIIFYNYDEELDHLLFNLDKTTYLCNGKEKNFPKKNEWDKVKNTITLANYKSGSEAVEFTYANIIIYFSPSESYTDFYQSYGRCHRIGQTRKITAYKFITDKTIEEDIYNALDNKKDFNYDLYYKNNLEKGANL